MTKFYSIPQAAELLEKPYYPVYWAVITGVVECVQAGHSRLLSPAAIRTLKKHFAEREAQAVTGDK